jgi:hypothetical protein
MVDAANTIGWVLLTLVAVIFVGMATWLGHEVCKTRRQQEIEEQRYPR